MKNIGRRSTFRGRSARPAAASASEFVCMSGMRRKNPWSLTNERKEKLDETKATLCRTIMKSSRQKGYTRRQLAIYLGTDKSNVSAIENRRVDRLSGESRAEL